LFHASASRLSACWERQQQQQQQQQQPQTEHVLKAPLPVMEYVAAAAGSQPNTFLDGGDVVIVDPPRKVSSSLALRPLLHAQGRV